MTEPEIAASKRDAPPEWCSTACKLCVTSLASLRLECNQLNVKLLSTAAPLSPPYWGGFRVKLGGQLYLPWAWRSEASQAGRSWTRWSWRTVPTGWRKKTQRCPSASCTRCRPRLPAPAASSRAPPGRSGARTGSSVVAATGGGGLWSGRSLPESRAGLVAPPPCKHRHIYWAEMLQN